MLHMGKEGIVIGVKPEPGANILDLSDNLETIVKRLNDEKLASEKIKLEWVYDQRPYIEVRLNWSGKIFSLARPWPSSYCWFF